MAYKYDPILRMNVPIMTTDGYKVKATGKADTLEEAKKFLSKQGKNIEHSNARKHGDTYYFDNRLGDDVGEWNSVSKIVKAYDERTVDKDGTHIIEYIGIDGDKQKQTIKGTAAEANKRIEELKQHGCKITKTRMFANWDHAIQAADASRIIEQKNGYTLGINSQGTICLAFPGETIDNPHMYLGKENEKNLADAKIMFKKFSSLRGK